MADPERSFGEEWGYRARNAGLFVALIGLAVPELLIPGLLIAGAGQIYKDSSKKSQMA